MGRLYDACVDPQRIASIDVRAVHLRWVDAQLRSRCFAAAGVRNDASPAAIVAFDHQPVVPRVAPDRTQLALPSATLDIIWVARHFSKGRVPERIVGVEHAIAPFMRAASGRRMVCNRES